jgi:acylphosphatase
MASSVDRRSALGTSRTEEPHGAARGQATTMARELREVWYTGHVQGVGFRYTALALAQRAEVVGYVQNLPDGRVHVLVEGESDELDSFLTSVKQRLGPYIREMCEDRRPATGHFRQFEIRT